MSLKLYQMQILAGALLAALGATVEDVTEDRG